VSSQKMKMKMKRHADLYYLDPLSVCYTVIADATDHAGHQSCISNCFLVCKPKTENHCNQWQF